MTKNLIDLTHYRQQKIIDLKKILQPIYQGEIEFTWVGENSRRKITLQIDDKNNLGFFQEKTHDLIEINDYSLVTINIQKILLKLKDFIKTQEQNLFSQIVITDFDNGLELIFKSKFKNKRAINFSQNQQLLKFAKDNDINVSIAIDQQKIEPIFIARINQISIANLNLKITGEVFLQATKLGLETIIDFIKKNIINDSNIADLYSGCGFYALSIAKFAKKIEAFEGENSMVEIINNNSKNLQLNHKVKGFCRDLFISPLSTRELKKYQTIIINPPRSGAKAQIKQIANCTDCQKLIYVSCNPQTFFSDAKIVIERYFKLTKIIAIDQFFLTKHLEVVAVFEKI